MTDEEFNRQLAAIQQGHIRLGNMMATLSKMITLLTFMCAFDFIAILLIISGLLE